MAKYPMTPDQGAVMELSRMDRRLVDMAMVGQDPSEGCVTYVIMSEVTSYPGSQRFATHQMMDWTPVDPGRGCVLAYGHYMMTYGEAVADMSNRLGELLRNYDWLDPYTGRPIRKGRRGYRC